MPFRHFGRHLFPSRTTKSFPPSRDQRETQRDARPDTALTTQRPTARPQTKTKTRKVRSNFLKNLNRASSIASPTRFKVNSSLNGSEGRAKLWPEGGYSQSRGRGHSQGRSSPTFPHYGARCMRHSRSFLMVEAHHQEQVSSWGCTPAPPGRPFPWELLACELSGHPGVSGLPLSRALWHLSRLGWLFEEGNMCRKRALDWASEPLSGVSPSGTCT
jgi:hypothetical protein